MKKIVLRGGEETPCDICGHKNFAIINYPTEKEIYTRCKKCGADIMRNKY